MSADNIIKVMANDLRQADAQKTSAELLLCRGGVLT